MGFETYGAFVWLVLGTYLAVVAGAAAPEGQGTRAHRRRLGAGRVLAACVAGILAVTLIPLHGATQVELVPFRHAGPVNDVGNVMLFAPFGAVLYLRHWAFWRAAGVGFAFSCLIETTQLLIPGRTTSTDDVIFNTLGAAVGWGVAAIAWRSLSRLAR